MPGVAGNILRISIQIYFRASCIGVLQCLEISVFWVVLLSLGYGSTYGFQHNFLFGKLRCKSVFGNEDSLLFAICSLWQDEINRQLLAKCALLIKDAQSLDSTAYYNFISALVVLQKRL